MYTPTNRFEKYILPIAKAERLKFFYLALFAFFVSIGNQTLGGIRDTLVITAPNSDATIIVYLRCFGSLPLGILFIMFFTWSIDRFPRERIFNSFFIFTSVFLVIFSFLIYPSAALLEPDKNWISNLITTYPHFKWFFVIFGNWTLCLYYLLNDLWLAVSLAVFFWQLANQVVTTQEAKRFYPLFMSFGGAASVLSGYFVVKIANIVIAETAPELTWMRTFQGANLLSVVTYLIAFLIHKEMWKRPFMEHARFKPLKSPETNLFKGFEYLIKSPYLRAMFFILLTNEMIYQFNSVLWKDLLNHYMATPDDLNDFFSEMRIFAGIGTIVFAYSTNFLIHHYGWRKIAYVAPIVSVLAVGLFLSFAYFSSNSTENSDLSELIIYVGSSSILILTWVSLAFVYTTVEMAYIPLSDELKTKGKTAVDVVSYNLGEGGAAGTDAILTSYFAAGLLITIPYVSIIVVLLFILWFFSVHKLAGLYEELTKNDED